MKYTGLIGCPVAHSLSPQMHNAAFAQLGIEARYLLWETPGGELEARVHSLRADTLLGANVTIPYKESVLPWLDDLDPQAGRIGAVNTIVNCGGRLTGYNTDAPGFLRALLEQLGPGGDLAGRRVVLLGNGGAARAAAIALLDRGVGALTILGRERTRLATLLVHCQQFCGGSQLCAATLQSSQAARELAAADIVVNTTPVGLKPDDKTCLLNVEALPAEALVMDMIFQPPLTPLLRQAQLRGCPTLNGCSMLLYQGTLALELWTGQPAPEQVMRTALGIL
ncbi:MAG TPA: shikimate dehydrogenase [Ktedonobacteraceae bacterium]|jgi:shikimate dehydrogenase